MKEENNIPSQNNECIPSEMLLRYLKGDLSGVERNRVERHVASCTMCSDELEGLSQLKNPEQIDEISNSLNERIDLLVEEPWDERSVLRTYLKIAAVIVLFIGISSVIYFTVSRKPSDIVHNYAEIEMLEQVSPPMEVDSNKDQMMQQIGGVNLTENQKAKSTPKSTRKEEALSKEEKSVKYVAPVIVDSVKSEDEMFAAVEVVDEPEEEYVVIAADSNEENIKESTNSVKIAELVTSQAAPVSVDKKSEVSRAQLANEELAKGFSAKKETRVFYNEEKQTAIGMFNVAKYKEALKIFNRLYKNYPNNDSIIYYKSVANYHLNRFEETIKSITPLTVNSQSVFYNEAKWYYGLSLVAVGRKQEAAAIFEQIIKDDSPFKNNATKELEKLK